MFGPKKDMYSKMEPKIFWDLYCFQCSLQFEKKFIYDMHLSLVYKIKKNIDLIKTDPEEIGPQGDHFKIGQPCFRDCNPK